MQYKCKSQEGSRQVLCVHRFSYMYSLVHLSYRKQYSIIEQCFQTAMMLIFFLFINSTPDSKHFCYFFDEISTWREMMNDTQRSAPSSVFGKGMCVFSVVYVKRYKLYPQILSRRSDNEHGLFKKAPAIHASIYKSSLWTVLSVKNLK